MSNPIEALKNYNINNKDIEKLKSIGITNIQSLYMTSRKNILQIKGFTEKKISNIFNEANKIEVYSLFQKGSDCMNQRCNNIPRISTGSKNLDNILEGGFEPNSLTEIIGEKDSNILDFVHILCINALKKDSNNKVIFMDLDKKFDKDKLLFFAKGMKENGKKCLEKIWLFDDIDFYDEIIENLNEIFESNDTKECSLIIIDSLIVLFKKLFKEAMTKNTQINNDIEKKIDIESKLGQVLIKLKRISLLYNIPIIITRIINNDNDLNEQYDIIKSDPNIELILNYECKTRLKFKKIKNDKIKCVILNSPMIPEKDCKFLITEKGIIDC